MVAFRAPAALAAEFSAACKSRDVTASQVFRAMMRVYVASGGRFTPGELAEPGFPVSGGVLEPEAFERDPEVRS